MAWQEFGFGRGPLTEGYLGGGMGEGGGGGEVMYIQLFTVVFHSYCLQNYGQFTLW